MKKIICLTLSLLLLVTFGTFSNFIRPFSAKAITETGTWTQIAVAGTDISSFVVVPTNTKLMYVGGKNGMFKSSDGGETWQEMAATLTSPEIKKIVLDPVTPTTLYVVDYAIDRSWDGGVTWEKISESFANPRTTDLVIDPKNPSILYACATTYLNYMKVPKPGGIWRSIDKGTTWTAINTGLSSLWIQCLAIDPLTPTTLYAGTKDKGIFCSLNSGETWSPINKNLLNWEEVEGGDNIKALMVNPSNSNILYAGDNINGIYCSLNKGASWQHLEGFERTNWFTSFTLDPTMPTAIYAGTENGGVFKSSDSGTTWEAIPTEFANAWTNIFVFKTPTVLYVGNNKGLYRYTVTSIVAPKQVNTLILKLAMPISSFNGIVSPLTTPPIIKKGRTLLPISPIVQAFGGTTTWTAAEKKTTIVLGANKLELWIGKNLALVNGTEVKIDVADATIVPEIIEGRTMLPLRFVAEKLGGEVIWNAEEKTITLNF